MNQFLAVKLKKLFFDISKHNKKKFGKNYYIKILYLHNIDIHFENS